MLKQPKLLMVEENTERVEREKEAQIMVVIGNPPYNVGQKSENDNNKNRPYPVLDQRIRDTYVKDSKASNKNSNYDAYKRFFRWATDRLGDRDGIVCFVSNNSFFGSTSGDGIRKHLLKDFTSIYHFDLKGDARTSGDRRRAEGGNVFEDKIREGVGITILIRSKHHEGKKVWHHSVGDRWTSQQKRTYLHSFKDLEDIVWQPIIIDSEHNWLIQSLPMDFAAYLPLGTKDAKSEKVAGVPAIFKNYGRGVATCRDDWAYDFDIAKLAHKIKRFIATYNDEIDHWRRRGNTSISVDDFVNPDDTKIKWSEGLWWPTLSRQKNWLN